MNSDNLLTKVVYDGTNTTTTTFAYTDANEQTSMTVGGTTTDMAYDAWGRMTSKTDGTYSATYAYRYGDKLYSVSSNFPNESTVTYEYGGDQKRRERSVSGGDYAWYNWDNGLRVINEENSNGTLSMTCVARLADVPGTSPSTGTWRFYALDNLLSSRSVRNADKSEYAALEYTPFGEIYASSGSASAIDRRYTGHTWDDAADLYYAPYRFYTPSRARWMTRDPLGMVDGPNVYAYAKNSPTGWGDPTGLFGVECCEGDDLLLVMGAGLSACAELDKWIVPERPDLKACIKRRCNGDAKVVCKDLDSMGLNNSLGPFHVPRIYVDPDRHHGNAHEMEDTLIHEWLHSCGYDKQDPHRWPWPAGGPFDKPPYGDGRK